MSKTAEIITGIVFFLFLFIIFTGCLLEALSSDDRDGLILFRFIVRCLAGAAWMYMAALISSACLAVPFLGIVITLFLLMIFLNIRRNPLFQDGFFVLCFILGVIYFFIAS